MEGALKRIKERRKEQSEQVPVPILSLCMRLSLHLPVFLLSHPPHPQQQPGLGGQAYTRTRPDFRHSLIWLVNDPGGKKEGSERSKKGERSGERQE